MSNLCSPVPACGGGLGSAESSGGDEETGYSV